MYDSKNNNNFETEMGIGLEVRRSYTRLSPGIGESEYVDFGLLGLRQQRRPLLGDGAAFSLRRLARDHVQLDVAVHVAALRRRLHSPKSLGSSVTPICRRRNLLCWLLRLSLFCTRKRSSWVALPLCPRGGHSAGPTGSWTRTGIWHL